MVGFVEVKSEDGGGGGGSVGALGRQEAEAVAVVVYSAQLFGQTVLQGRRDVSVDVVEQRLLGPGIVVVLGW